MNLNHLNLPVSDIPAATALFTQFFGFALKEEKAGVIAIMENDAGFVLIVSDFEKGKPYEYPRDFHIGFYLESREAVDRLYGQLSEAGFPAERPPKVLREGWTFYVKAFGTILIEVTYRLSEVTDRGSSS